MRAGWFTDVQTGQARAGRAITSGVEGTPCLCVDLQVEETIEVSFEDGLESAENELSAGCGVDENSEVMGYQVFGERFAVDTGKHGQLADESVCVGVEQREDCAPDGLDGDIVAAAWELGGVDDRDPRLGGIGRRLFEEPASVQPCCDSYRVKSQVQSLGLIRVGVDTNRLLSSLVGDQPAPAGFPPRVYPKTPRRIGNRSTWSTSTSPA